MWRRVWVEAFLGKQGESSMQQRPGAAHVMCHVMLCHVVAAPVVVLPWVRHPVAIEAVSHGDCDNYSQFTTC